MVRDDGSSARGDGGRAVMSLRPDFDGTGSGSCLGSILSTFLKKMIQWCLGSTVPATSLLLLCLLPDILGLKQKYGTIVLYMVLHSTVLYKVYKSMNTCRRCMHVTMHVRHVNRLHMVVHANAHLHLWKLTTWNFICKRLTVWLIDGVILVSDIQCSDLIFL